MRQRRERKKNEMQVIRKNGLAAHPVHASEGSWAVSYADLLMVLLSFFILFFNFKEPSDNPPVPAELQRMAREMKGLPAEGSLDDLMDKKIGINPNDTSNVADIVVPMQGSNKVSGAPVEASMDDLLNANGGENGPNLKADFESSTAGIKVPAPGTKKLSGAPVEATLDDLMNAKAGENGPNPKEKEDALAGGITIPSPGKKLPLGLPVEATLDDLLNAKQEIEAKIAASVVTVERPVSGVSITNGKDPRITEMEAKLAKISTALNINGVKIKNEKSYLVVTMEDSAFQPASFAITPQLKLRINDVLVRLAPHFDSIQLTVVGHADRSTLLSKSPLMEDNFDLSSIRALKVLKYMVGKGFPEKKASARASSFFDRDARSISIVIQPASLL